MLGHEFGVLAQAIARSLDLDDHSTVEEPIEDRGCDDGIADDVAPDPTATDGEVSGIEAESACSAGFQ